MGKSARISQLAGSFIVMLNPIRSFIYTNQFKLLVIFSVSLFVIGVIAHGVITGNNSNNQFQRQVIKQVQPISENQGQVAGIAVISEPTPTLTKSSYKPVVYPTNTPIPSSSNQPQTGTNMSAGNNSQTNQNTTTNAPNPTSTSTQTSNPIYIPQQPSIIPPTTVPEPTVIINLEISINSTEGTVKANKPL